MALRKMLLCFRETVNAEEAVCGVTWGLEQNKTLCLCAEEARRHKKCSPDATAHKKCSHRAIEISPERLSLG